MTDAQIEVAAQELCRLRGLDPSRNAMVGTISDNLQRAIWEVQAFAQIGTAIAHALAVPQKTPTQRKKSGTPK